MKKIVLILAFSLLGCEKKVGQHPANAVNTSGYEWVLEKDSNEDKTIYDCFNTEDNGWEGKVVTGKKESAFFNAYYTYYDSFKIKKEEYGTFKDLPSAERFVEKKAEERKHEKTNN